MVTYYFKTEEFGISNDGVHLLRSGFNHKTIRFSEITRIKIERGKELHNWWLVLILGVSLVGLGIFISMGAIEILLQDGISPRHARLGLFLLVPVVGAYFVYNSLQTGLVLKIECVDGSSDMFPLKDIAKQHKLKELRAFLNDTLRRRVQLSQ